MSYFRFLQPAKKLGWDSSLQIDAVLTEMENNAVTATTSSY